MLDQLYAMLLEGLLFLGINPVECAAVGMLRFTSLILVAFVALSILAHRLASAWLQRHGRELDDPRAAALLRDSVRRSGLSYEPRLLQPPAGAAPVFTAGGRRGIIYLRPELATRLEDDELRAVLLHEIAHLRERDQIFASWIHMAAFFLVAISIQAVVIGFFFQREALHFGSFRAQIVIAGLLFCYLLLRHFFRSTIGYLREIDCDQAAVTWGARPTDLASALVETGRLKLEEHRMSIWLSATTALAPRRRDLESRVRRLLDPQPRRFRPRLFLRRATLLALLSILLFAASFHIRSATSPNPPTGWARIVIP